MGKKLTIIFLLVWHTWSAFAQEDFSSPLPIVIIETDIDSTTGQHTEIPDEPKVGATMEIIYVDNQTVNHLSDRNDPARLNYSGRIGIETRGSTSQVMEKKPYGLETRNADGSNRNVSLLGMPKENDWVLNALNLDYSLLRDCLAYTLGRRTGHYAPRTHYCEVFVNGDYKGLYILGEKIKIDKNRVNIAKISISDSVEPNVSGGYIFKADRLGEGETEAWQTACHDSRYGLVLYIMHSPKPAEVTESQVEYIHNYFNRFTQAVAIDDSSELTGYPALIDVGSFVDFMLVGELASNVDIYQLSTFFHKDRNGKLCAGPLWDFNYAYGNDDYGGRSRYDVWQFDNKDNNGSPFWYQLFNSPYFHRRMAERWYQLSSGLGPLSYHSILRIIDSIATHIEPAIERESLRWGKVYDYEEHLQELRTWLLKRHQWMNIQLLGEQSSTVPTLVPNPTLGRIALSGNTLELERIDIFDLHGHQVFSATVDAMDKTIDLTSLPSGIYIAHIVTWQETKVQKIVKISR